MEAFKHGKDVVLMNAELDATIGPILQEYAKKYGVIMSACDGDEPGVQINLYRWVCGLGLIPRVIGNIKGLQDPYRNPTTQKGFAEKWGQNPAMVTSFAGRLEDQFRAGDRRECDRLRRQVTRYVSRFGLSRRRDDDREALRH
jgi:predicted homoserine dehydrogenase-like protein